MKNDMANESDVANTSNPEEANYINEADFQASIVARIRDHSPYFLETFALNGI